MGTNEDYNKLLQLAQQQLDNGDLGDSEVSYHQAKNIHEEGFEPAVAVVGSQS